MNSLLDKKWPPLHVGFEGLPGAGKSTLVRILSRCLLDLNIPTDYMPELDIRYEERVRSLLDEWEPNETHRILLLIGMRSMSCKEVSRRKKDSRYAVILTDRSWWTIETDVEVHGLPRPLLDQLASEVEGKEPDLTFLLKVDLEEARRRKRLQKEEEIKTHEPLIDEVVRLRLLNDDCLMSKTAAIQDRLAKEHNWHLVDANQSIEVVSQECLRVILEEIRRRPYLSTWIQEQKQEQCLMLCTH